MCPTNRHGSSLTARCVLEHNTGPLSAPQTLTSDLPTNRRIFPTGINKFSTVYYYWLWVFLWHFTDTFLHVGHQTTNIMTLRSTFKYASNACTETSAKIPAIKSTVRSWIVFWGFEHSKKLRQRIKFSVYEMTSRLVTSVFGGRGLAVQLSWQAHLTNTKCSNINIIITLQLIWPDFNIYRMSVYNIYIRHLTRTAPLHISKHISAWTAMKSLSAWDSELTFPTALDTGSKRLKESAETQSMLGTQLWQLSGSMTEIPHKSPLFKTPTLHAVNMNSKSQPNKSRQ